MIECENNKGLLMGLMDQELTSEEAAEINTHLIRCATCREEYEELRKTAEKIEMISFQEPGDEILEKLWKSPYSRFSRQAGIFMVIGGYLTLIGYGLFEFLTNPKEAVTPKVAVVAIVIGILMLLITVIRERVKTYKVDPYKEIQR